jgi:hypothetical protein
MMIWLDRDLANKGEEIFSPESCSVASSRVASLEDEWYQCRHMAQQLLSGL